MPRRARRIAEKKSLIRVILDGANVRKWDEDGNEVRVVCRDNSEVLLTFDDYGNLVDIVGISPAS